jgi:hypothetical protein
MFPSSIRRLVITAGRPLFSRPAVKIPNRQLSFLNAQKRPVTPGLTFLSNVIYEIMHRKTNPTSTEEMRSDLVRVFLSSEYVKYEERKDKKSNVFVLINKIPANLSQPEKVQYFCNRLVKYRSMPVITAHPTRIFSNEMLILMYETIKLSYKLNDPQLSPIQQFQIQNKIKQNVSKFLSDSLLPDKNLTPKQESEMGMYIYKNMLESFPEFNEEVVAYFIKVHGGERADVSPQIKSAIMRSYEDILSWINGDADGNKLVTAATMSVTIPTQQKTIIEIYMQRIEKISSLSDIQSYPNIEARLTKMHVYLNSCLEAIEYKISFDVNGSEARKAIYLNELSEMMHMVTDSPILLRQLNWLHDMMDLAGFAGGIKEYVRQTSIVNDEVYNNLTEILVAHNHAVRKFMRARQTPGNNYQTLSLAEKKEFLKLICSDPTCFADLARYNNEFLPDTQKELDRLLYILENKDRFSKIILSDTIDKTNFNEMNILMRLASHIERGTFHIGQLGEFVVDTLPLCESPTDLRNFENIFRQMLTDPGIRKQVARRGFISYVSGPSDATKVGGIMVYIMLLRTQMLAEDILKEFKDIYPELANVELLVLYGYGPDFKRQLVAPSLELHTTHQGWGALDTLGAPGAYPATLHETIGWPSETQYRVEELRNLRANFPNEYNALLKIEDQLVSSFEEFMSQPATTTLFRMLADSDLEKIMNKSSRAGSKKANNDPTKCRAIGLVNHYHLIRLLWDVFMSLRNLSQLDDNVAEALPSLFNELTQVRNIIYKVLYSVAISDTKSSWDKVLAGSPEPDYEQKLKWSVEYHDPDIFNEPHHVLAHIEMQSLMILLNISLFLSGDARVKADEYMQNVDVYKKTPNVIALELMDALGGNFSDLALETREMLEHTNRLDKCIEQYRQLPNADTLENIGLACRGVQLAEGVATLRYDLSPKHKADLYFQPEVPEDSQSILMSCS